MSKENWKTHVIVFYLFIPLDIWIEMPISGSKASDASKTTSANNAVGKVGRPSVRNWEKNTFNIPKSY